MNVCLSLKLSQPQLPVPNSSLSLRQLVPNPSIRTLSSFYPEVHVHLSPVDLVQSGPDGLLLWTMRPWKAEIFPMSLEDPSTVDIGFTSFLKQCIFPVRLSCSQYCCSSLHATVSNCLLIAQWPSLLTIISQLPLGVSLPLHSNGQRLIPPSHEFRPSCFLPFTLTQAPPLTTISAQCASFSVNHNPMGAGTVSYFSSLPH
jgi:hypothetical protein